MAKGKHAAALFEVINKGNSLDKPVSQRTARRHLALPKWWSNRADHRPAQTPTPAPASETAGDARPSRGISAVSSFWMDRGRRLIALKLSYRAAVLSAIGAVAALAIAFSLGRRMGQSPSPLLSLSTEQLRAGPARPQVLEVSQTTDRLAANAPADHSAQQPAASAAHAVIDTQRSFGLNYVVIQSYLNPKEAQEAKDLLIQHDIFCTIEKNLPHYGSKGWYSVVGLTGFDRIRGVKEYQDYIRTIQRISSAYDAKHTGFKKFDPQPYKWR